MPEFKHQQPPEASCHRLATVQMIVHQFAHALGLEVTTLKGARLEQDHQHVFKLVPHPVHERKRESLFLAIENLARNAEALGQFSQDVFLLAAAQLPLGWQSS